MDILQVETIEHDLRNLVTVGRACDAWLAKRGLHSDYHLAKAAFRKMGAGWRKKTKKNNEK